MKTIILLYDDRVIAKTDMRVLLGELSTRGYDPLAIGTELRGEPLQIIDLSNLSQHEADDLKAFISQKIAA